MNHSRIALKINICFQRHPEFNYINDAVDILINTYPFEKKIKHFTVILNRYPLRCLQ